VSSLGKPEIEITTVGGISIVGGALVKLSQNALFTHILVALVRHYELAVAILRVSISSSYELTVAILGTFLDFYAFSLILRILLIQLFLFYSTIRRISLCFYEFY
jgi:hypothetical protein